MPCGFKSRPWYHMADASKIGVFDSGFGGLDVFGALKRHLPEYDYLYLADSARAPYGSRTKEEITAYTEQAVRFLFSHDVKLIILACNTASSDALRELQMGLVKNEYPDRNILGVLIPAAEESVTVTKNKRIGVIGTEQTISSGSFNREIMKLNPEATVFSNACPRLVPLIEQGTFEDSDLEDALREYLLPLIKSDIDTLVLGCTHYGLIEKQIRKLIGTEIAIIRESTVVPGRFESYIQRHPEYENSLTREGSITFYTTGPVSHFEKQGERFFGSPIHADHISLA